MRENGTPIRGWPHPGAVDRPESKAEQQAHRKAGGRHRPHLVCAVCGTSLHCDRSRASGLCRVHLAAQQCEVCGLAPTNRLVKGMCESCYSRQYRQAMWERRQAARRAEGRK